MANKLQRLLGKAKKAYEKDDLSTAKDLYQSVLNIAPRNPDALHAFGVILAREGNEKNGLTYLEQAYQHKPNDHHLNNDIGNVLLELNQYEESVPYFKKSLKINPNIENVYVNLAIAYFNLNLSTDVENIINIVLEINPNLIKARLLLAELFCQQSKIENGKEIYVNVLKEYPNDVEALYGYAHFLYHKEENTSESINHLLKLVKIEGENHKALSLLADIYKSKNMHSRAKNIYIKCLSIKYNYATLNAIASVCYTLQEYDESHHYCLKALEINPKGCEILHACALLLEIEGDYLGAGKLYMKSLENTNTMLAPITYNNMLLLLNYVNNITRLDLLNNHLEFNANFVKNVEKIPHDPKLSNKNKKIKIAYISADFRRHSVSHFMLPIMRNHNHDQYEVHIFYTGAVADDYTEEFKQYADVWHNISYMDSPKVNVEIVKNKIDILIELSGHTAGNSLRALFNKPAPIQISYLGYSSTTGIETIDYRITDKVADPIETEKYSTEKYRYMPNSYFCYEPPKSMSNILIKDTPALCNEYITLGTFNSYKKYSDATLKLWGEIYQSMNKVKFIFKDKNFSNSKTRSQFSKRLIQHGIDIKDVHLEGYKFNEIKHFELYNKLDIALDTTPYNGATTTCEALWMGVPVVTLQGELHVSRMSSSILFAANLGEYVAQNNEEYINIIINLSSNIEALNLLRMNMREQLKNSPLMDAKKFTLALEDNYSDIWGEFCE